MDPTHFDRLARTIDATASRRRILGGLLGLAGAAAATRESAAATRCLGGRRFCRRNNQCCSGVCNLDKAARRLDRNRCTCAENETLVNGRCIACQEWEMLCGNRCVQRYSNNDHCGACGNRCPVGTACSGTECLDAVTCAGIDMGYVDNDMNVYETNTLTHYEGPRNCTSANDCEGACPGSPCVCITGDCFDGLLVSHTGTPGQGVCEQPII